MINKIYSITTLFILLLSAVVFGQDQIEMDSPLTFKEAVKLAMENNISIKKQQNQLGASNISKTSSLLQLGPSVSIGGETGRRDGNSFNQQEGRVINGVLDFTSATFRASMPLFQGFSQLNNYKASKYRLEAQMETVEWTKQNVIQLVTAQYLQCLLDEELVRIAIRNVETQEKQLEQISSQVEAGSRAEIDVKNQEFQLKNAQLNLLRAQNTLRNDKATLAQTLQLEPLVSFSVEEPSWNVNKIEKDISIEQLYTAALENRSDLEVVRYTASAQEFGYKAAKGNYYPSVFAFFNYGSAYNYIHPSEDNPNPVNRSFNTQFSEDNLQKVYGISFNIPIFGGFATRSNVVQSRVNYENAQLDVENLEVTVKSEVLRAYQNLQDAITTYEMTQAQLKAAELSHELGGERYNLGISNLVEYTQANQDFVQAQADFASARYTLMFQELLMDYATGTLNFEDIK